MTDGSITSHGWVTLAQRCSATEMLQLGAGSSTGNTGRQRRLSSSACSTEGVLCAGRHCCQPAVPCLCPHLAAGDSRQDTWLGAASTAACWGWVLQEVCGTASDKEKRDLGEGKKGHQISFCTHQFQKRPHPSAEVPDGVPWLMLRCPGVPS